MPQQCFWLKPELIRLHYITIHILPPLCNILFEFQLPQILLCKGTSSLSRLVDRRRKPVCLCHSLLFNLCSFGIFWTNAFLKYFNLMVQICSSNSCAIVTLTGTLSALCHSSPVLYFSPACLTQVTAVGIDVCSLSSQKCKPTACPFCSRTLLARERDPHSITASLDQPSHQHFSPVLTWGFREGKILSFL